MLIYQYNISDVTSYAHHVFKAFDVETTGSISFRVRTSFTTFILLCEALLLGHAGLPLHLVAWDTAREAELDLPHVRPER